MCIHTFGKRLQSESPSHCFLPIPLPPDCMRALATATALPVKAMPQNYCQLAKRIKGMEKIIKPHTEAEKGMVATLCIVLQVHECFILGKLALGSV